MIKRIQGLFIGVCIGVLLACGTVLAKQVSEKVAIAYNNIQIYIDGEQIVPKDASGKVVEPFILNGTTYLPVRAVATAFEKAVHWDGATQSVYIGQTPSQATPAPTTSFNAESILNSMTHNAYTWSGSYAHYLAVTVKNNAACTATIESEVVFKDANGAVVGKKSGTVYQIEPGKEGCFVVSNDVPFSDYEIIFKAKERDYYTSVQSLVTYTVSPVGEKIIVGTTNNGAEKIDSGNVTLLLFKNGQCVGSEYVYMSQLNPGQTIYFERETYNKEYDTIQAYVDGYIYNP